MTEMETVRTKMTMALERERAGVKVAPKAEAPMAEEEGAAAGLAAEVEALGTFRTS